MKSKISEDDIKTIDTIKDEGIKWLESHQNEDKETYENKLKEYTDKVQPIIMKMYQQAGGQGMPGGMPNMSPEDMAKMYAAMNSQKNKGKSEGNSAGPKIEEVD